MSDSANFAAVRRAHESIWDITPGSPGGRVHQGFDSVVNRFFGPLRPADSLVVDHAFNG